MIKKTLPTSTAFYFLRLYGGVRTDVDRTTDRALVSVDLEEVPAAGRLDCLCDEGVGRPACAHVAPCSASTLHALGVRVRVRVGGKVVVGVRVRVRVGVGVRGRVGVGLG